MRNLGDHGLALTIEESIQLIEEIRVGVSEGEELPVLTLAIPGRRTHEKTWHTALGQGMTLLELNTERIEEAYAHDMCAAIFDDPGIGLEDDIIAHLDRGEVHGHGLVLVGARLAQGALLDLLGSTLDGFTRQGEQVEDDAGPGNRKRVDRKRGLRELMGCGHEDLLVLGLKERLPQLAAKDSRKNKGFSQGTSYHLLTEPLIFVRF
ncbi:TPA: hypothetical protein DDZ06_01440 [Candidatus Uhrbacteria bacterium]|nr:hypothetical protein [Candidatus Uhrbacteria bacterium]